MTAFPLLRWTPSGGRPRACTLDAPCDVGRDPTCRIILSDPSCSRRHLVLTPTDHAVSVHNVSRSSPAYINDRALPPGSTGRALANDIIRVGTTHITVASAPAAKQAPTLTCANPTCARSVPPGASDCPWCGRSLAFAHTHAKRRV